MSFQVLNIGNSDNTKELKKLHSTVTLQRRIVLVFVTDDGHRTAPTSSFILRSLGLLVLLPTSEIGKPTKTGKFITSSHAPLHALSMHFMHSSTDI